MGTGGSGSGASSGSGSGSGSSSGSGSGSGSSSVPQAPSRGPERPVYSLVDNRLSAHRQRAGGLLVAAGSAGFVRYLRFSRQSLTWKTRQERDGVKVAVMGGKSSSVTVPLSREQAAGTPTLRLRSYSAAPQRLGFRINGKQDKEVTTELAAGWSTAEVAVPEGALEQGENEIIFFAGKSPVEMAWLQVGGTAAGDDLSSLYDESGKALVLPEGGGLAYYVMIPEGGLITGDLSDAKCQVAVRASPEDGAPVEGKLVGRGSAVKLDALAGKVVRLEVTNQGCPEAKLSAAALVVAGEAPKLKRPGKPKHVVLWIMDSLRADHIGLFLEGARAETPIFAELAKTSAVFAHTYVQGNETKCSHASIWTSLYPMRHKMIPPNSSIDFKWVTVDEVAKSGGLLTSGVSGNGYITPKRGFGEKWDKFRNHIHDGGGLAAEDILTKGIESLAGKEKDPWFLYLGTIDTHVSWRAKEPWFGKYDPDAYSGRFTREASGQDVGKIAAGALKINDRDLVRLKALYDSNVSYQDQQVGKLLEWLDQQGIRDDTMIILTADHGDELMEEGRIGHGSSLRSSLVWVPMVIHYPPLFPAGRVPEGADTLDIVPTIADVLGVEPDPEWQGESLLPLAQGLGRGYPRLTMASLYENAHAGQMGQWKLRAARGGSQLFDMATEPEEKTDVGKQHPYAARMVADALWLLRAYNEEWRKAAWGNPANVTAKFAADMKE